MAILDYEGFDQQIATTPQYPGWLNPQGSPGALGGGVYGYGRDSINDNGRAYPNTSVVWMNAHVKFNSNVGQAFGHFMDVAISQVIFRFNANMQMYFSTGGGDTTASPIGMIAIGAWHFIQVRALISNAVGNLELWIDNVMAFSWVGDTQVSANAWTNRWRLGCPVVRCDNVIIYSEVGNAPNARTPETRIYTDLPIAVGNSSGWTPLGGGNNFDEVKENPSDGDITYVSAAAAGPVDTYQYPAATVPAGTIVYAVGVEYDARKDDVGANETQSVVRSGGADTPSGVGDPLSIDYTRFKDIWDLDPATGLPWTVGGANATEVGVTRTV